MFCNLFFFSKKKSLSCSLKIFSQAERVNLQSESESSESTCEICVHNDIAMKPTTILLTFSFLLSHPFLFSFLFSYCNHQFQFHLLALPLHALQPTKRRTTFGKRRAIMTKTAHLHPLTTSVTRIERPRQPITNAMTRPTPAVTKIALPHPPITSATTLHRGTRIARLLPPTTSATTVTRTVHLPPHTTSSLSRFTTSR